MQRYIMLYCIIFCITFGLTGDWLGNAAVEVA